MIKSMTGFGKGEATGKFGRFIVEIRTVNHRYFDLSARLPNSLSELEDRIKKFIHGYIKRGKVNFSLLHSKSEKEFNSISIDEEAVQKYYRMLNRIKKRFNLKDEVRLSHVLSFPDVIIQEGSLCDPNLIWPLVEQAARSAVIGCNKMREREGKSLYSDLKTRTERILTSVNKISSLAPGIVSEYKAKLDSRLKDVLKERDCELDRTRLATEIAIFARQCDVSEEITRARSHLKALKNGLESKGETGRKLDFILQELQREINTLGSKAGAVKISRFVVDIKSEIEKIREQVQNIE